MNKEKTIGDLIEILWSAERTAGQLIEQGKTKAGNDIIELISFVKEKKVNIN